MNIEEELGTYKIDTEVSNDIRKYLSRKNQPLLNKTIKKDILQKYKIFIEKADSMNLNPDTIFNDTKEKKSLLRNIMGYTYLKTKEGRDFIDNCSDAKIGLAFRNTYYNALKVIK
jgi:hypothetical protein